VADPIEERREAMAARFEKPGSIRKYYDHTNFFEGENKLDAVYVAVPPAEHDNIELECVARKWPFKVEKPMTLDPKLAKKVADGVAKAGLVTAVGFQDRYMNITDIMKNEIAKTDIAVIHATWAGGIPGVAWWRTRANGGGQLVEQNIHMVDLIRYLFGDYESVYAAKTTGIVKDGDCPGYDVEDSSTAVFKMKSGAVATFFTLCYLIEGGVSDENGMTAFGRQRSIYYSLRDNVRIMTEGETHCYKHTNDQAFDANTAFFDAVRKADPKAVRSPYGDALKSLNACFAAVESMDTGKVVKL
jgi:predicted dehydrogenase